MTRRIFAAVTALALAFGLAACTGENDDLADTYRKGNNQGFISGDGRVTEIAEADRGDAVEFSGTAVDGSTISSADYAGEVLVINFWYAQCGPCRAEAPILEDVHTSTSEAGANFLGVNIYDGPEQAASFDETYGITYPSILARGDVDLKLAFADWTSLQAAPTTLVLDKQGRVAASIFGQVTPASKSIFETLVEDALEEQS
ncbi:TlpA family protein disulfide reductase [Microbacterium dauci]|uniref:TlpA disulfide reductase family protein n=1 Tax=Microbacterium dauci TaxID=3048008 RepID=A0ABT6ZEW9_9MICO|nr:TlpA disulfide reductase family protein [Microbacterium sp. LX3-4]MDJ1114713.1 TlpA disulfide reductase family protein [Microbacterium sp. LX3-4]